MNKLKNILKKIDKNNFRRIHKISWIITFISFILIPTLSVLPYIGFILGNIAGLLFVMCLITSLLIIIYGIWKDYDFFND